MSDTVEGLLRQGALKNRHTYVCTNLGSQNWQNIAAPWVIPSISEAPPYCSEHQDTWTAIWGGGEERKKERTKERKKERKKNLNTPHQE